MVRLKLKVCLGRQPACRLLQRPIANFFFILFLATCGAPSVRSLSGCPRVPASNAVGRLSPPNFEQLKPAPIKLGVPFSGDEIDRLNQAFRQTVPRTGATAASITIARAGGGSWSSTIGVPSKGPKSFWWASVGKLVTATIILQMVEEGHLALDQTIDRWFPDYPGANRITVDQLLMHTSGVFTFNYDRQIRRETGYHSPEQLIAISATHRLDFCPGTQWHYSNTGYVMLGIIAEKIDGYSIANIVNRRIARRIGLRSLRIVARDSNPEMVVPFKGQTRPNALVEKISSFPGAGGIVADPKDMVRLLQAWVRGPLLTTKSRNRALHDLFPMFGTETGYGRGIMVMPVPDAQYPTTWLGHLGGSPNSKGVLIYDLRRQTYVALVLNTGGKGEALVNTLLKVLDGP